MYTAKASIISWWIFALISMFLWYRNERFDRALSVFIFTIGLIELIEYGVYSGADLQQSSRAIFITLWLQCLVLAMGVYIFINHGENDDLTPTNRIVSIFSGWTLFLFTIVFVVALIIAFTSSDIFSGTINSDGYIEWYHNDSRILGDWIWLYILGIFGPLFILFAYYSYADIGIAALILYGILSAVYLLIYYPPKVFNSMWAYVAIGFAFLVWLIGIIPESKYKNI